MIKIIMTRIKFKLKETILIIIKIIILKIILKLKMYQNIITIWYNI